MWISKKRLLVIEKRIADIEEQVQSQKRISAARIQISGEDLFKKSAIQNGINAQFIGVKA